MPDNMEDLGEDVGEKPWLLIAIIIIIVIGLVIWKCFCTRKEDSATVTGFQRSTEEQAEHAA